MSEYRCHCGGVILADAEDLKPPLCADCYWDYREQEIEKLQKQNQIYKDAFEQLSKFSPVEYDAVLMLRLVERVKRAIGKIENG